MTVMASKCCSPVELSYSDSGLIIGLESTAHYDNLVICNYDGQVDMPFAGLPPTEPDMRRYRIRLFARLIIQSLSSIDTDIYLRCHQWFRFHEIPETLPCIAFALAPTV